MSRPLTPAEALLWSYGITQADQIDLDAIACDQHAMVRYRPLEGCEARLVAGSESAVISVNNAGGVSPGRQRFSLAHELAHWLCDRRSGSFLCAKTDIGPQNAEAKSVEAHANGYASQLILPTYLVDPWLTGQPASLEVARALSRDFRSSVTAAAIKLIKRTPHVAFVAAHARGRLIWHQRSSSVPTEFYVLPELHQDTDGFTLAFGGTAADRSRREPASRWVAGPNVSRMEAVSHSFRLAEGTVLSVVAVAK